jgi:hypothetical protein
VRAEYVSGMNPGMQIRVEQQTLDALKRSMEFFLPRYFNEDLDLPKEFHTEFSLLGSFVPCTIDWTDITYKKADLDVKDIKIKLTRGFNIPLLKVDFPALKSWEIDATQTINSWFFWSQSKVELVIEDFDIDF